MNASYGPNRSEVINHFDRIARQFRATDDRLERAEYNRTEPGHNWAGWFHDASRDLRRATDELASVVGYGDYAANDVLRRLEGHSRTLDDNGRQVDRMDRYNERFGYGWGRVLDGAIRTVDDALHLLTRRY